MKYQATGSPAAEARTAIVRLWDQRAAGANDAIFDWGYLSSPVGSGQCFLLHATDDGTTHVVGGVGVGARRINAAGANLAAGVLGDFFVLKGHRTFFPALSMQRAALDWSKKNLDILYGFPNASAQPIIKRLGFKSLATLERHVLVLRHAPYIAPKVRSKIAARAIAIPFDGFRRFVKPGISLPASLGLSFVRFETFDERFDRLFEARTFQDLTVGHRDAKLLQWRFLDHPAQPSRVYGLVEQFGRLRAYAVVQNVDNVAHVRDLLGVDVPAMAQLLRLVAGDARSSGNTSLSFICAAPVPLKDALLRLGFQVRDGVEGPRTLFGHVSESITEDSRILSALHHWYATEADEDQ